MKAELHMDSRDVWLLDIAVEHMQPIGLFGCERDHVEGQLNRSMPPMSNEEIVDRLQKNFAAGLLFATDTDHRKAQLGKQEIQACIQYTRKVFAGSDRDVVNAFKGPEAFYYGLTAQGGARWEEITRPDWDWFVICQGKPREPSRDEECPGIERWQMELAGRNRTNVARCFSFITSTLCSYSPIPGSESWTELANWNATYWKTFPKAYRLCFEAHAQSPQFDGATSWSALLQEDWYQPLCFK